MADTYANSNLEAGSKAAAPAVLTDMAGFAQSFETAATYAIGDVVRICRLPVSVVIAELDVLHDAITGGSDVDIGFYEAGDDGAVIDKDILTDGDNLTVAGSADGLQTVDKANRAKTIKELIEAVSGSDFNKPEVDLAFTFNSDVSAAGTITVIGKLLSNN